MWAVATGDAFSALHSDKVTLSERASNRYNRRLFRDKAYRNPLTLSMMCVAYGIDVSSSLVHDMRDDGRTHVTIKARQDRLWAEERHVHISTVQWCWRQWCSAFLS